MADQDIVIASGGLISPIGLSLPEAAASARARVARIRESELSDSRHEAYLVGRVPDDALPPLVPALADLPLQARESRMLRMAHAALEEALSPLAGHATPIPLLLGLPEHHTTLPIDPAAFLGRLAQQVPGVLDIRHSLAVPRGRAAGLMALCEAASRLRRGNEPFILVGGVDCLVDPFILGTFDFERRIRNDINSDGFSPSEGAAFLLLSTAAVARAQGVEPLAQVVGSAHGFEAGHLYSDDKYLGEGLCAAFASIFEETPPPSPIGSVYCSFNGERYWAREFGVARLRHNDAFVPEPRMEHPAECFGDMGSAVGVALAALAAHGVHKGYREAPCLVYASSDRGERAVSLLVPST